MFSNRYYDSHFHIRERQERGTSNRLRCTHSSVIVECLHCAFRRFVAGNSINALAHSFVLVTIDDLLRWPQVEHNKRRWKENVFCFVCTLAEDRSSYDRPHSNHLCVACAYRNRSTKTNDREIVEKRCVQVVAFPTSALSKSLRNFVLLQRKKREKNGNGGRSRRLATTTRQSWIESSQLFADRRTS